VAVPLEKPARIARELATHGYAADREAITLLAGREDTADALAVAVEATPDDALKLTAENVREALESRPRARRDPISEDPTDPPPPPGRRLEPKPTRNPTRAAARRSNETPPFRLELTPILWGTVPSLLQSKRRGRPRGRIRKPQTPGGTSNPRSDRSRSTTT
jgi:hypothetical protein